MQTKSKRMISVLLVLAAALVLIIAVVSVREADGDIVYKKNFGGSGTDVYYSVAEIPGGYIAVGYSENSSFGSGDWSGAARNGGYDAIIVKYDDNGNVVWAKNFGGSGPDCFNSVTPVPGGFVAVGYSGNGSFGNGDWSGVAGKGGNDAIVVKYDDDGNVVWKKNFGGAGGDYYYSVTAAPGGFIAAGYSEEGSFGYGDWSGVAGKGGSDAIIVKYDNSGNVVWKKNFGGPDGDYFRSVTAASDGFIAVGYSEEGSFGNGDWSGVNGKGDSDAIAVKYDGDGNITGKRNFGGSGSDAYQSVTAASGGFVAVGESAPGSFGNGDWSGVSGKGGNDAIAVKQKDIISPA